MKLFEIPTKLAVCIMEIKNACEVQRNAITVEYDRAKKISSNLDIESNRKQ